MILTVCKLKYAGNYSYYLEKHERQVLLSTEITKAKILCVPNSNGFVNNLELVVQKAKYRIDAFTNIQQKATQVVSNQQIDIAIKGSRLEQSY